MQEDRKKYASVYQLVNLPHKRKIIPVAQSLFQTQMYPPQAVTPDIKKARAQMLENIQKQLDVFEDVNYSFKFPPSKFPAVLPGERNNISYEVKVEVEDQDTFKDKLSEEQIQQIRERGEFEVKSSMKSATIPYVWKINDFLLRGRVNIINIWENGLAACYSKLTGSLERLIHVVPASLNRLAHLPVSLFTIIFGRRSLTPIYTPDYEREVFKDFWTDVMKNELADINNQLGHKFLEVLYLKYEPAIYQVIYKEEGMSDSTYNQLVRVKKNKEKVYREKRNQIDTFKNSLRTMQQSFRANWLKIRRKVLAKVSAEVEKQPIEKLNEREEDPLLSNEKLTKKDQAIIQRFHQEKYLIYKAHLKENLPKQHLNTNAIEALVSLITIISLINQKMRLKNQKLQQIRRKISTDIEKQHRIRSKNNKFQQNLIQSRYNPIESQVDTEFYSQLFENEIGKLVNAKYQTIYRKYVTLRKDFNSLVEEKKKTLKSIYVPERIFYSTYLLLPPYQIKGHKGSYTMSRTKEMTIDTSTNFWKFKLYAMRLKCWTINCAVFLIGFAWVGPTGLRCLFGAKEFKYDEYCNYETGVREYQTRKTVIGTFKTVTYGIKRSRDYFESLPDRGLFGKKFSRYFNYLECYVFRLFFVGIIGVLILYPITIIVLSVLSVLLIVTVWIWVPLIMVVCYIFNILVFQFESSNRPSGVLIRGVPLLSLAFVILSCLLQILFSALSLIIISPLVSLVYFLFLVIQRGFRTFTDAIMIVIIAKLGRTPSRDTSIARKISGPGTSRGYYCSIAEEDVYVLTQAKLERIYVQKFISLTRQAIESQTKKYFQIMRYVLDPFGYSSPSLKFDRDIIVQNKNKLLQNFNKKSQNFLARYPSHPRNVRFTAEEIDQYFDNSIKIVKNFVEKERIQNWIFDQHSVLNEDYDELTRSLWMSIFGCGEHIFEPLENIDGRLKITDDVTSNTIKMKQNIGSVMKALEGEIQLSQRAADFNPAKSSLLDKDRDICIMTAICDIQGHNSEARIDINLNDPSYLFVCPRNLEELKVSDQYTRKNHLKRQGKVFEE